MIEIIPFGDINLLVETAGGDALASYRVSSHILQSSCGFFRAMLSPTSNFSEAQQFHQHLRENEGSNPFLLKINIEDHNLDACETILKAVHGKLLPTACTGAVDGGEATAAAFIRYLSAMTTLAQYLHCAEALREWVEGLMSTESGKQLLNFESDAARYPDIPQMLMIASTFGLEKMFRTLTAFCVNAMAFGENGKFTKILFYPSRARYPLNPIGITFDDDAFSEKMISKYLASARKGW